jgi:hypothetical protein
MDQPTQSSLRIHVVDDVVDILMFLFSVLRVSRRFQKVPEGSGMFRKVIEELETSRCFWKLPGSFFHWKLPGSCFHWNVWSRLIGGLL